MTEVKYADAPAVKPDDAKKLTDVREQFAPNADKPTSASADKGMMDLPQIMKKVDPENRAQVIPEMYKKMQGMMNIMSMGSGNNSDNNNQNNPNASVPSGISVVMEDALTGALCILVREYGFERVIQVLLLALADNGIRFISADYKKIVQNAISNLIRLALFFGPLDIPVSQYDDTIFGDIVPDELVPIAPDLYIKQYYAIEDEPYPGYIQWKSPDGATIVYTRKETGSYHFETPEQEVYSNSEIRLSKKLDPYFPLDTKLILTAKILNRLLIEESYYVEADQFNNNMGNNTGGNPAQNQQGGSGGGSGGMNGMMGMLSGMLNGNLQGMIGNVQQKQLPNSVLDQEKMNKLLNQKTKDMSLNNNIFGIAKDMMGGANPLGALGNMGGLSNIMGGFNQGGGGIGGVTNGLGMGNLLGNLGSFGGGSGGGGGGAGSGFPTASAANSTYDGGNISDNGLKDVKDMLVLLGIS